MGFSNIPSSRLFVILSAVFAAVFAPVGLRAADISVFAGHEAGIQFPLYADAPSLPQLRRSAEIGLSVRSGNRPFPSFSLQGFFVDASIPAGLLAYRGYLGGAAKAAVDFPIGRTFLSFGISANVARYSDTELTFISFGASAAPGIASRRNGVELRVGLPLAAELRGDALAFSAGLRFRISGVRK